MNPGEDDSAHRARIRGSLTESLIVEAAAGTGKTTELIQRMVAVLAAGASVQGIVAVTFTRKAAGELVLRLRQALDEARRDEADAVRRGHLEDAISRLEEARIGTIHSFCADLLRERPVEAGIDPAFRSIEDAEARRLFDRVFRKWIEGRLEDLGPVLSRAFCRLSLNPIHWEPKKLRQSPVRRLAGAAWQLVDWRDYPGAWQRDDFDVNAEADRLFSLLEDLVELARKGPVGHPLRVAMGPAEVLVDWLQEAEQLAAGRDHKLLEARLVELARTLRKPRSRGARSFGPLDRDDVEARRVALVRGLEAYAAASGADLAAGLRDELSEVVDLYTDLARREGALDFLDLLIRTRDLIVGNDRVREHLQRRFSHLFVDEFQDTDAVQAEILLLLAADDPAETDWTVVRPVPGKLFLVGDPKQSIYRFRRADVVLYQQVVARLGRVGVSRLRLGRSFRATAPLQGAINAAFETVMNGEDGQASWVPLSGGPPGPDDQPSLVCVPIPRPFGTWSVAKAPVMAGEPGAVAAFLDWMLNESGWTVRGMDGRREPVRPGHVALLFRRFSHYGEDISRNWARAFEDRRIPHLTVSGRSFHDREEVETLRTALRALEWPEDELSLYATLRGYLFAITDETLFLYRETRGRLNYLRPRGRLDESVRVVGEALDLLAKLHHGRNRRPFAETIGLLLARTRAWAGFALRPSGAQILANVQRILERARSFEASGGLSFRGFCDSLESGAMESAPALEDGVDAVRLLTVHAAKGLEFPVVILADITAGLSQSEPDRWIDRERRVAVQQLIRCRPSELAAHSGVELERDKAEGARIAYVAATRARDLLVMAAVGGERAFPPMGWVSPLEGVTYPAVQSYDKATPAPGCPPFSGNSTILQDPPGQNRRFVRPGRHRPKVGDHEVVWWDPLLLDHNGSGGFGLVQELILAPDEDGAAEEELRLWQEWRAGREEVLKSASIPRHGVTIATEAAVPPPDEEDEDVTVQVVEREPGRPSGRRFGTLVHDVLQRVPFSASAATVGEMARLMGRIHAAPDFEVEAAARACSLALQHPVLVQAAASPRCHREYPFVLDTGGGELLEGQIDLLYLQDGRWRVVDFKTDADLDGIVERHRRQVGWYAHAVAAITGIPSRGLLLAV